MKNALFATTALVAAGLAGAASANEGFTTTVGGYMNIGAGYNDIDNPTGTSDTSGVSLIREGEIHFNFKAVADNGLTFTGRVELEGATGSDQIDENWAAVSGSFGRLEIGGHNEARTNFGHGLLYGKSAWGGYFDHKSLIGASVSLEDVSDSDSLGIHYYTPNFSGFQAGFSYQPGQGIDGSGDKNSANDSDNDTLGDDALSLAAQYTGEFNGVSIAIGGGYTFKQDQTLGGVNVDADIWSVGGSVGYAGFTAAAYWQSNEDGYDDVDGSDDFSVGDTRIDNGDSVALGIAYGTGPWKIGGGVSFATDADYDSTFYGVFGSYDLAPGVTAGAFIEHGEFDPAGNTDDVSATAGAVFLSLSF